MDITQPEDVAADWVFAYGSLIWNPEFNYQRAELGCLYGYHRAFCIGSTRYRGTPERPGVVLGLDRGGICIGVLYQLPSTGRHDALTQLFRREMPVWEDRVYRPSELSARLADGSQVRALAFVAERSSRSYRRMPEDEVLARLRDSHGLRGPNRDYAINTWQALRERGVRDSRLERIARLLANDPER